MSHGVRIGSKIPLLDVGVRKGGIIIMDTEAARMDLGTPYVHLPKGVWDVLALATNPEEDSEENLIVDCEAKGRFPDLVFGLAGERQGDGDEYENGQAGELEHVDELIVRPEQYILRTEEGRCVLLVRSLESSCEDGEIVLGWAAIRGRNFVLDWTRERIGFGK
jgi:hypothetical protein